MKNKINSPGKILFFGGYSVITQGNPGLSIAVVDKEGIGVEAEFVNKEERIISEEFNINIKPSVESMEDTPLVNYPYVITKLYLESKNSWNPVMVKLKNSSIMGDKNEKSGLGSSAAVTSSVVKALFKANGYCVNAHIETIHKLAQYSYLLYSKKIGSGFDIATATYGKSIVYYRFDENEIIFPKSIATIKKEELKLSILRSVEKPWKNLRIKPFKLKSVGVSVLFFKIKHGKTDTRKAAGIFKEWKNKNIKKYNELIDKLAIYDKAAITALKHKDYEKTRLFTQKGREIYRKMQEEIKKYYREFEDIEPKEITKTIDYSEKINGVITGKAPGAGGKDGVAFIVKETSDSERILKKIEEIGEQFGLPLERVEVREA